MIAQAIFSLILLASSYFIYRSISRIVYNIQLGKPTDRSDQPGKRLKTMLLVALGQKKMFKRPIPAILHLFVYIGFLIVNIEMLEIVVDGLSGAHRIFANPLGTALYGFVVNVFEFFAVAVILVCIIFLIRRNILGVKRFGGIEMTKWPVLDANVILVVEILLMLAFLSMNAADQMLQQRGVAHYVSTAPFVFSASLLIPVFGSLSDTALVMVERVGWWFHIIGVLLFANYVFYNSKHLHIFMAFFNTYYSKLEAMGKLQNMPEVTKEVKLMLNLPVADATPAEPGRFGAKDIQDLTWKNLMEAYSCTECGRCTSQCPANLTGKQLSPRKIMMDTRDRMEEVGQNRKLHGKDYDDGKALLGDYISVEEINACTTCNACVEACPVNIDPVSIILQLRRFKIMEESQAPASWNSMFSNLENNAAPWKFSTADRFNWSQKLNA